ncbi:hypothetical protein HQN60_12665 [Deefgea piscis]|uniref:Uncharacterized protein n=1 Tax=Deefgea piscis TaxID=2739061 RepID=A0A6M8SW15_9NEIS|nr:hypothetical protein [Deefgea piscis]QKJ67490.1 hypothetical protein HQN60_12665 [Deefgea piscis]
MKALIENNAVVAASNNPDQDFHPILAAQFVVVPEFVQQGWRQINGQWSEPLVNVLTWDNASRAYFHIDIGAFYDRFGSRKLGILSSTDPLVMAVVRDTSVRQYIDLKNPDVSAGVNALVSVGLLNEEQASAVMNLTTQDNERFVKGLPQPE